MNEYKALNDIYNYVRPGPRLVYHYKGRQRLVYINNIDSEYIIQALPRRRPLLLPFVLHSCLVRIKYENS